MLEQAVAPGPYPGSQPQQDKDQSECDGNPGLVDESLNHSELLSGFEVNGIC